MKYANEYDASLASMLARAHEVPPGWRAAFNETLRALRAIRCPQRADVKLIGPTFCDIQLTLIHTCRDRVIKGIVARLERKTEFTCEICGQAGIVRSCGAVRVLCSSCAAPWLLREELTKMALDLNDRERSERHDAVPFEEFAAVLRPVIPQESWKRFVYFRGKTNCDVLTTDSLFALRPWFDIVKKAAEAEINRQEAWRELDVEAEFEG